MHRPYAFLALLPAFFLFFMRNSIAQTMPAAPLDSITTHAALKFEQSFFDFGAIVQGGSIVKKFQFVNTGVDSLRIRDVKVTCGCTIPIYPKEPIAPGGVGEIQITFNTAEKMGRQLKVIRVVGNTVPEETILQMSGEVKAKKKGRKQ